MTHPTVAELRRVILLADLADDDLAWLAERSDVVEVPAGALLFPADSPADWMLFALAGTLEARRDNVPNAPAFVVRAGDVFGVVPFSRMQRYAAAGRAVTAVRVARFPRAEFPALLRRIPALEPRLVALIADRVRDATRRDQQVEKLSALGRLSAGLAHELNNPAAAARRAALEARRGADDAARLSLALADVAADGGAAPLPLPARALAAIDALRVRAAELAGTGEAGGDALERADREDALTAWLADEAPGADGWTLAAGLADAGLATADLDAALTDVPPARRAVALAWLEATLAVSASLAVIESATGRISELVAAVKRYTHMDRALVAEPVDVRAGIESALTLLAHRVRDRGVTLARELPADLPPVRGFAGELNQVWTNLVDNAIDAAAPDAGDGAARAAPERVAPRVTVRAWRDGDAVVVDVGDSGPGVPEAIRERIWEPFFTTKDVGRGTGLGLDIVRHIVAEQHCGAIELTTAPGDTHFTVRLPIAT